MLQIPSYGYGLNPNRLSQNQFFFPQNQGVTPVALPSLGQQLSFNGMNTPQPLPVNNVIQPMGVTGYNIPSLLQSNPIPTSASGLASIGNTPTGPVDSFLGKIGLNQNNIGIIGGLASTLASLGGAYSSWRGARIADKQFNYNRAMQDSLYANSLQDYNRKITDMARSRDAYYTGKNTNPNEHFESDYTRRWEAKDNRKK